MNIPEDILMTRLLDKQPSTLSDVEKRNIAAIAAYEKKAKSEMSVIEG